MSDTNETSRSRDMALPAGNLQCSCCTRSPDYMNLDEAARYTKLGKRVLQEHLANGRLRVLKVGRRNVFAREDLQSFMNSHATGGLSNA